MKSVFRSVSELRTTTTNHHRLLLLNLRSHSATKPTKPLKPPDPSEPKPTAASTSADSPPRSWTSLSPQPTDPPPPPSPSPPPTSPPPSTADWARPGEIPFQASVANSVNLIGHVQSPVRFHSTPGGSSWASTVITQKIGHNHNHNHDDADADDSSDSLPLWVPIIFDGDLAHIAACHLKENGRVYINGQLTPSLHHLNANQAQASVQVKAHDPNFIWELIRSNNKKLCGFQSK